MENFKIIKPCYKFIPRAPIIGDIMFTGVIRDTDPDGTILGVTTHKSTNYTGYSIGEPFLLAADNTALYNASTGGGYTNVTAYIISFPIMLHEQNLQPVVTATASINLTGTGNAIVNQILPIKLTSSRSKVDLLYTIVLFGANQKASNDLLEAVFTPKPIPFDPSVTISSGINFVLNFSY